MWKELLSTSGSSNMFKLLWATIYSLVLQSLAGRQKRHEVNLPRWLFMSTCMIMYAHVIRLRCTALHIITALRVLLFLIFLLETSTVINKETAFQSFHSLVEFSTISTPARPDLCWRGAARYTSYGQLLGAAEIHTVTWRPGDLATWPAKRRAAPSEDEPGSTGSTTEKLPKPLFEIYVSEIFCLKMFEIFWNRYFIWFHIISWLFNTFHIPSIDLV